MRKQNIHLGIKCFTVLCKTFEPLSFYSARKMVKHSFKKIILLQDTSHNEKVTVHEDTFSHINEDWLKTFAQYYR